MVKKIIATLILVFGLAISVAGIVSHTAAPADNTGKLQVVASYYPLYDFAQQVGGDKVAVSNMTPAGAEPHNYEPSAKALADAHKAPVFIYNGGQLEPWVNGFIGGYTHVKIKASNGIMLRSADADNTAQQSRDPHFWLDPVLAATIIDNIRDGLSVADPADAGYFAQRADDYKTQLHALDASFTAGLASCSTRTIVTSHAAFGYLASRYNLDVQSITGVSPEAEPSAAKLAELSTLIRTKDLHYVFFESLVSPRLAQTIAAETGAQTLVFDPIEGVSASDQKQGKNYITIQEQNLANIRTALACR